MAKLKAKIKTKKLKLVQKKLKKVSINGKLVRTVDFSELLLMGGTIGQWGSNIAFSVNSEKQLSFRNMKRTSSSRWASHNIIGKRPKMEYLGIDMDEVTLEVVLSAEMGVRPRSEMKKFRAACKSREVNYLYINGKKVCANKMAITAVSESWDKIWSQGELVRAVVAVTFSEYR